MSNPFEAEKRKCMFAEANVQCHVGGCTLFERTQVHEQLAHRTMLERRALSMEARVVHPFLWTIDLIGNVEKGYCS